MIIHSNLLKKHKNSHWNYRITPFRFRFSPCSDSSLPPLPSFSDSCFPSQGFWFTCPKSNLRAFPALCLYLLPFEHGLASFYFPKICFLFSTLSLISFSLPGWFARNYSCYKFPAHFSSSQTQKCYPLLAPCYEFFDMLLSKQAFLGYAWLWNVYGIWVGKNGIFCNRSWRTSCRVQGTQAPNKNNIFLFSFQQ